MIVFIFKYVKLIHLVSLKSYKHRDKIIEKDAKKKILIIIKELEMFTQ